MKRKLLSLLLAFSLLLSAAPVALAVESREEIEQADNTDIYALDQALEEENANADISTPENEDSADERADLKDVQDEAFETQPVVQSTTALGSAAELAGLTAVSQTHHAIANGVTYDKIVMRNKNNQQAIGYMTEIDLTKNVKLKATYDGYYTSGSTKAERVSNAQTIRAGQWSMKETTKLAADYSRIADQEGTVVMATNGDYFNMGTGEPTGYLVMEGNVVKTSYEPYFAILTDGTAVIRDAGVPTDDVMEAVSGPFYLLKNGLIQQASDGAMNPRNSVGIRADGSVVFFMAEGRLAPRSIGMDYYEVASVLKDAGCVTALYLDGGGSATFAAREEGGALEMLSKPSDGQERTISSGILCISTDTQDGVFDHATITPRDELYTPGSEVQFRAAGVDRSGGSAELPDDLEWKLADVSADMGEIDQNGLFHADKDSVGNVTVELLENEAVVGTASIEVVKPDAISFNSDEISLAFEQETDLGLVVRYQNRDVNIKTGDIVWTLSDTKMGSFIGNIFKSADGYSVTAEITATSAFDDSINSTIKTVIGMLPTVVWDFEDHTDEKGNVTAAQEYYCGENGILTHHNYGRGGQEDIEIVSIDDGEPVRFGSHALKLNYDFTRCGEVTEGACIGTLTDSEINGVPTGIGVWVYAPEGVGITYEGPGTQAGFWLRGYVKTAGSDKVMPYDFTLEPKATLDKNGEWNGTQPGVSWTGWKYLEADLTNLQAPFSISKGDTLRLMFVNGTKMGTRTAGSIYFDNLQFVYGTNVDDVDNPLVNSIKVNNEELTDGATISGGTIDLRAEFSDAPGKCATGVDASTVRLYVDDVNMTEQASLAASDGHIDLYGLTLANGDHTVTVSLRDGFGNDASETRHFTVKDSDTERMVEVTTKDTVAAVGGEVVLELRAESGTLRKCDVTVRLGKQFTNYEVVYTEGFTGTQQMDGNIITIHAEKTGSPTGNTIALVKVKVPSTLADSETFLYEVKSGVCYDENGQMSTFAAPVKTLPIGAAISVISNPVLAGQTAELKVTDLDGNAVSGAKIYQDSSNTELGTTDENGVLRSDAFQTAGIIRIYAVSTSGQMSMRYDVYTYDPVSVTAPQVMFNASQNSGSTCKNLTWLSDPTVADAQQLRYREQGSEEWETITAETKLRTFVTNGYQAVNVNKVTITGLKQENVYEYQVSGNSGWSELSTFHGGIQEGAGQKFFLLGDIQAEDRTNITNIFNKLKAGNYDFGIQTGDAVDKPTSYQETAETVQLLCAENLGDTDVIHVLGNHEFEGDGNADIAGSIFDLPAHTPGSCWSTTYGNVYVAVVNYSGNASDMKTAMEWLVRDAKASNAEWKILTVHQPAYYTNATGGSAPMTAYVPNAVEEAGIDVVFSGHDHSFARTNPLKNGEVDTENGVYYYICGSSGEKSYQINSKHIFDYDKIFAQATTDFNAVYLSVETDRAQMKINVYDVLSDGSEKLLDSVTLKSVTGSCADKGHELENPVCSNGKLICNNCHEVIDPSAWNFTGWARDEATDRKMYFFKGIAQTGWFLVDEDNYCFDENGVAYEGEQIVDEVPFVFHDGLVVGGHTGFIKKSNGKTYYYDNGKMALGMTNIGDETYYFNTIEGSDDYGAMATGWQNVNSSRYYFDREGRMWQPIRVSLNADSSVLTAILTPFEDQHFADGRIAMWSQHDGQDDLKWFRGVEQNDGRWIVTVPMCNYKDLGRYQIHAYDGSKIITGTRIDITQNVTHKFTTYTISTNNCVGAETQIAKCDYGCGTVKKIGWVEKDHVVTGVQNQTKLTVKMADVASHGHTKVKFAVWSEENGQDDLVWYDAVKQADGNWEYEVDLRRHRSVGAYQIHAYACTGSSDTLRMAGHVVAQVTKFEDVTAPKVSAAVSTDCNGMQIIVKNAETYDQILLPVWSEVNGQDDIKWYQAAKQADGTWTYMVNLEDHNSIGRYQIHVYGTKNGKQKLIANTVADIAKLPETKQPSVEATVSEDCSTVRIAVKNAGSYDRILLPVWSEVNGQDDIKWYQAAKQVDGIWTYTVNLENHNSIGRYQIQIYGTKNGKQELIANTVAEVAKLPEMRQPTVEAVVSTDCTKMELTVRNAGGYDQILLPVWSEVNWQDDIKWYQAAKQANGTWTYTVNLVDHNSIGRYLIHVYGTKNGKQELIANTQAFVERARK